MVIVTFDDTVDRRKTSYAAATAHEIWPQRGTVITNQFENCVNLR